MDKYFTINGVCYPEEYYNAIKIRIRTLVEVVI